MACFLVSAAAAVVTGVTKHAISVNEKKADVNSVKPYKFGSETKWTKKLSYLELTLWGGSFLLAGEHILHGEVTPFPPFLTAMSSPEDTQEMLYEMGTVGVAMLAMLLVAWGVGVVVYDYLQFKKHKKVVEVK